MQAETSARKALVHLQFLFQPVSPWLSLIYTSLDRCHPGFDDFFSFICCINGSAPVVLNYTSLNCSASTMNGPDLNLPSITIAVLNQTRTTTRTVTNIADDEAYSVSWSPPYGVSVSITPAKFSIENGKTQDLTFVLNATMNHSSPSFGRVGLYGSRGHVVNIPISVISKIIYNSTVG